MGLRLLGGLAYSPPVSTPSQSGSGPRVPAVAMELGERFAAAGHELALVGGWVRDAVMRKPGADLDFTTDATPEQTMAVLAGWAETTWDVGARFGTIGAVRKGEQLEITTYRAEAYDATSRKPEVQFGRSLVDVDGLAGRGPDPERGHVDLVERPAVHDLRHGGPSWGMTTTPAAGRQG